MRHISFTKRYKLALATSVACVIATLPLSALAPGDTVSIDAISKAEFLQGEPPTEWHPGEVYVFECWATWCGPCIAAIPHINALHQKYKDRGLNITGMNVFENRKSAPEQFLKRMGYGMSYPVAFVGNGGFFQQEWLDPAGVNSIPYAFVVKDGKFLFGIHPASLDEAMVEDILAGGEREESAVARVLNIENSQDELKEHMGEAIAALEAGDVEAGKAAIAKIESINPNDPSLEMLRLFLSIAQGDWAVVDQALRSVNDPNTAMILAMMVVFSTDGKPDVPSKEVLERMAALLGAVPEWQKTISDHLVFAKILWMQGKQDEAVAAAQAATGLAENDASRKVLRDFAKSFGTGDPQALSALSRSLEDLK